MATRKMRTATVDRDGTGQPDRLMAALRADHVLVDERTIADLVAFAREYGKELRFFGLDDEPTGDWSGFVPPSLEPAAVEAFARGLAEHSPTESALLSRPHFVLYLVFLLLLDRVRGRLNDLTARHLDFYYRTVLRMAEKPPVPDAVNVLVDLAAGHDAVLLPAGTLLSAPPDLLGLPRTYATDRDLVTNRARVAELRSVRVELAVTDYAQVRLDHRGDPGDTAIGLFRLALGEPRPGDPLPPYPGAAEPPDPDDLDRLATLAGYAEEELDIRLYELRDLIRLKRRRDGADDEWDAINDYLTIAAEASGNHLELTDPRDFEGNLAAAIGGEPDFSGVPEVDTVYDAYEFRSRLDVQEAIRDRLYFEDVNAFVEMMHIKTRIDNEWREINRILEGAGRRQRDNPAWELQVDDPAAFDDNYARAIGTKVFPPSFGVADLGEYHDALVELERYFVMPAEGFLYVMRTMDGQGDWAKADEVLTGAYRTRLYAARRAELQAIREAGSVDNMLRHVLGEPPAPGSDEELLDRIEPYLGNPADMALLQAARSGGAGVDWNRVYEVAEVAQRNREGIAEPVPRREEWVNLHPAEDATSAAVPVGTEGEQARWHTFGSPPVAPVAEEPAPTPVIGWAVGSPILALAEGRRVIEITLELAGGSADATVLRDALAFEVTTEKGWVPVAAEALPPPDGGGGGGGPGEQAQAPTVGFRLELDEQADPVAPVAEAAAGPGAGLPAVRISLRELWDAERGRHVMAYSSARDLQVAAVRLRVEVTGLAGLQLRNDDGTLDPTSPFEPFSARPVVGSRLLIGHPELATKRLDSLGFRFEWMGVPPKLTSGYYKHYPIGETPTFTVDVKLVDRRAPILLAGKADLFPSGAEVRRIAVPEVTAKTAERRYERLTDATTDGPLPAWDRYVVWELRPIDFQHGEYRRVSSEKAIQLAAAIARDGAKVAPADYQVNPPWTPVLQYLTVDYTAAVEIRLDGPRPGDDPDELYHLHPFGYAVISRGGFPTGVPFVPRYEDEGELYVGLDGVAAPQTVSFLFQMSEGSADPDLPPATVRWSALDGGGWVPLDNRLLLDTTNGLLNSGIVELALPAAAPPTLLPAGRYWVRAAVARNPGSVADTVAVHTQAVSATFVDEGNAPEHYLAPLPKESIAGTVRKVPGIAAIRQPYTSFGGRPRERDDLFATRVSERLRHKQRALSMWDYERLVLEQFPQIYKAKCLPAAEVPGAVDVIVIPDIRKKLPFNSFEPKAAPELLAAIALYLRARVPEGVDLRVRNAHFRLVRIRCGVRFATVGNDEFYKRLLVDELDRFLSPWAFDEGADIVIGSKIYANSIVNFIDRRPYVEFVANLRLFYSDDGLTYTAAPPADATGYHVPAGAGGAVLRAAPDHRIDMIPDSGYRTEMLGGIGHMQVELDFTVAAEPGYEANPFAGVGFARVEKDLKVG